MKHEEITDKIIKAFYKVYNTLGYGFLDKVYERAMLIELKQMGLNTESQSKILVYYYGNIIGDYCSDLTVENVVICELKAAECIVEEHEFQLINYLKATTIEVSGFYSSPSIWQGTFKSAAIWSVDGGVQQTLFKGKATAKASVTDVFQTLRWSGVSDFAGQYMKVKGGNESRQVRLGLIYRFGSSQVKNSRQRKTSAEEEGQRVGSQGGGIN